MLSIALFPVIAASMCSCQKELTYASENNERHVDISFKWNNNNRKSNMLAVRAMIVESENAEKNGGEADESKM